MDKYLIQVSQEVSLLNSKLELEELFVDGMKEFHNLKLERKQLSHAHLITPMDHKEQEELFHQMQLLSSMSSL